MRLTPRHVLPLLTLSFLLFGAAPAGAADPNPNPNLIPNPGFEDGAAAEDNLWDGVDGDGNLSVFRHSARAVTENHSFDRIAMPPSVAYADLKGDGKPDLIVADPTGYFHFYPNVGTAKAPRFTTGELVPLFVSTAFHPREHEWSYNLGSDPWRFCPRIALADWRHSGVLDLLIGNYFGEVFFIPNAGSAKQPIFRQPATVESARLPTSEKKGFWANLLAPAAVDWNGTGKLDLILGEGTYSADAIHLIENTGTGTLPKFADAKHVTIAYGDGREHLIPTVADWDGDGKPDLIVADRTGEIGVYLNPGKGKDTELKRVSTVSFGGNSKLPGLVAPYAADFNGDGLFDLIFGLPNGHVAVALNTGTKGQPSFGPLQDIKGVDRLGRNVKPPRSWTTSTFPMYGNALAYFSVVDATDDPAAKPPEGGHCLKAGYWPLAGETFSIPPEGMPGALKHFVVYSPHVLLELNKSYQLSFKAKNVGMKQLHYDFTSRFNGVPGAVKVERGERGELKNRDSYVDEWIHEGRDFDAGSDWTTVSGTLSPRFKSQVLKDQATTVGTFEIEFWASNLSNTIYFDDFSLAKIGR